VKKKKKKNFNDSNVKESTKEKEKEKEIIPIKVENWIGETVSVSGANFVGEVVSQKLIARGLTRNNSDDTITLLYFKDSSFVCNAKIVNKIVDN